MKLRHCLMLQGVLMAFCVTEASAQSFSFYSTLRSGRPGADWQVGVGPSAAQSAATWNTRYFSYSPADSSWRGGGLSQDFEIGFDAARNVGYTRVRNSAGAWTEATLANTGAPIAADTNWNIPASSFWLGASGQNTASSISLASLTLSPNLSLISGSLPTSLAASQSGSGVVSNLPAPLVINAAANGGSWFLAGTVTLSGFGTATGSRLQFNFGATSNPTPEASTLSMLGAGFLMLALARKNLLA